MERRKCRILFFVMLIFPLLGLICVTYFCSDFVCVFTAVPHPTPVHTMAIGHDLTNQSAKQQGYSLENFDHISLHGNFQFNIDGEDVLVFLHIQKTGGTAFGKHLVRHMNIDRPCKCYRSQKRCDCRNINQHIWLFSRYSVGWPCGLHADWTELKNCVESTLNEKEGGSRKRNYFYITILREPSFRYLSEWKHVQRGSTWMGARLMCNGRQADLEEVPFCFTGKDWSGVTLDEFMQCPYNLANNRQTRMLANLSLIGCYNKSSTSPDERDAIMLRSAKDNLRDLAFFGLTEYQQVTKYMFEKTFSLRFTEDFIQLNQTHATKAQLTEDQQQQITTLNNLDIELYQYAKELFFKRLEKMKLKDLNTDRIVGLGVTSLLNELTPLSDKRFEDAPEHKHTNSVMNLSQMEKEILQEESEGDNHDNQIGEDEWNFNNQRWKAH